MVTVRQHHNLDILKDVSEMRFVKYLNCKTSVKIKIGHYVCYYVSFLTNLYSKLDVRKVKYWIEIAAVEMLSIHIFSLFVSCMTCCRHQFNALLVFTRILLVCVTKWSLSTGLTYSVSRNLCFIQFIRFVLIHVVPYNKIV